MKTIASFLYFLLTPVTALANPENGSLVGHFRYADINQSSEYTFRDDGMFTGNVTLHKKIVWECAGTWAIGDGMLNYKFTASSVDIVPVGTTGKHRLIEIKSNYFVVEDQNSGRRWTYSRVRE